MIYTINEENIYKDTKMYPYFFMLKILTDLVFYDIMKIEGETLYEM